MAETEQLWRELLNIPEEYEVLFLGGGASTQFFHVPANLLNKKAAYLQTGVWAKKAAKEVLATKVTIKLDPMTSDERRVVHKVLTKYSHIETESVGEGKARAVTIKYVD